MIIFFIASEDAPKVEDAPKDKTPIDITNAETIIANRLVEISDIFLLASCLDIKDSKALVEQFTKNHRGKSEHIRIEVIDAWLKAAEERYWEDLIEILQGCLQNRRLAKSLSNEFIIAETEKYH